jgi:hypothetical protein
MLIAARESFAAAARRRLPYDAEVEYLESTGTQYFDTDIEAADDVGYQMHLVQWASPSNTTIGFAGVFGSDNRYGLGYNNVGLFFRWWNTATSWNNSYRGTLSSATLAFNFLNSRSCSVAGIRTATLEGAYNASSAPIRILNFQRVDTGANALATSAACRIGPIMISSGSAVIRDYIAVRVGTTGELYDRITGTFAARVGTLTVGPDKTA